MVSRNIDRKWGAIAGVMIVAGALVGCSSPQLPPDRVRMNFQVSTDSQGTYDVPSHLPDGNRGDLIASASQGADMGLGASDRVTLLYRSVNSRGQDVVVSGVLLIPQGDVPAGGWPLISWAHGTVGIADRCAPSHSPTMGGEFNGEYVKSLLHAGYAVAATDYIGLGTPGDHTYMGSIDQGNAVADVVPAARQIYPHLSENWFVIGHSQGGAAALSATRAGVEGQLPHGLKAVIAIGPGNSAESALQAVIDGTDTDPFAPALDLFVLIGAAAADQNIHLEQILSPQGQQIVDKVRNSTCLADLLNNTRNLPGADIFLHDSRTIAELSKRLGIYGNPDNGPTNGPVLIITGDADTIVPTAGTLKLIDSLRRKGSEIDELILPGQGHIQPLYDSFCEQQRFLAAHSGPPAPQTCPRR